MLECEILKVYWVPSHCLSLLEFGGEKGEKSRREFCSVTWLAKHLIQFIYFTLMGLGWLLLKNSTL